jgi:hypothetical protein
MINLSHVASYWYTLLSWRSRCWQWGFQVGELSKLDWLIALRTLYLLFHTAPSPSPSPSVYWSPCCTNGRHGIDQFVYERRYEALWCRVVPLGQKSVTRLMHRQSPKWRVILVNPWSEAAFEGNQYFSDCGIWGSLPLMGIGNRELDDKFHHCLQTRLVSVVLFPVAHVTESLVRGQVVEHVYPLHGKLHFT